MLAREIRTGERLSPSRDCRWCGSRAMRAVREPGEEVGAS
jgi:hypothetical protein